MAQVAQTLAQLPQATAHPLLLTHGIPTVSGPTSLCKADSSSASFFLLADDLRQGPVPVRLVALPANWPVLAVHAESSFRSSRRFARAADLHQDQSGWTQPRHTSDVVVHLGGSAADSSADAVLDLDAVFPADNSYNGRYERLIVAFFLPQTLFGESLFYLLTSRLPSPTRRPTGSYFLTTP